MSATLPLSDCGTVALDPPGSSIEAISHINTLPGVTTDVAPFNRPAVFLPAARYCDQLQRLQIFDRVMNLRITKTESKKGIIVLDDIVERCNFKTRRNNCAAQVSP